MARRHALADGSGFIDTPHLVLGVLEQGSNGSTRATEIIDRLGVDPFTVQTAVRRLLPRRVKLEDHGQQIPYTPRAKRCLELALELANRLGHAKADTAHLLFGAVQTGDETSDVLACLGLTADRLRACLNGKH